MEDRREEFKKIEDIRLAASLIGSLLYGHDSSRIQEFSSSFVDGVDDYVVNRWKPPEGIGPISVGYILGAVWSTRRKIWSL